MLGGTNSTSQRYVPTKGDVITLAKRLNNLLKPVRDRDLNIAELFPDQLSFFSDRKISVPTEDVSYIIFLHLGPQSYYNHWNESFRR